MDKAKQILDYVQDKIRKHEYNYYKIESEMKALESSDRWRISIEETEEYEVLTKKSSIEVEVIMELRLIEEHIKNL